MTEPRRGARGREWVAITLAVGVSTALNLIVLAVLYDALRSSDSGISENATQILTGWGGGIIGLLGSYIGFRAGTETAAAANAGTEPRNTP